MMHTKTPHMRMAVFCFPLQENHILLIERASPPWQGFKTIPGGHKHVGETLRQACLRELREESGYQAENLFFAGLMQTLDPGGMAEYLSIYYLAHEFSGELRSGTEGRLAWEPLQQVLSHRCGGASAYHPALLALLPAVLEKRYPFEALMRADAGGKFDYRLYPYGHLDAAY